MTKNTEKIRDASAIVAEMLEIKSPVAGTLSQIRRTLANGTESRHHILQYWKDGRHVSKHVPAGQVSQVRDGIQRHSRLKALLQELGEAGAREALRGAAEDALKKKRRK
jgi:hypothetical protein